MNMEIRFSSDFSQGLILFMFLPSYIKLIETLKNRAERDLKWSAVQCLPQARFCHAEASPEQVFCISRNVDFQWRRLLRVPRLSVNVARIKWTKFQTNADNVKLALDWNLQSVSVWKNNQLCQGSEESSLLCSWIIYVQGGETVTFPVVKAFSFFPTFTNTTSIVSTITSRTPLLLYLMIFLLDPSQIAGGRK